MRFHPLKGDFHGVKTRGGTALEKACKISNTDHIMYISWGIANEQENCNWA